MDNTSPPVGLPVGIRRMETEELAKTWYSYILGACWMALLLILIPVIVVGIVIGNLFTASFHHRWR